MRAGTDSWIGVLGGGQLGRMLALAARRMDYKVLKWTGGDRSGAAYTADLVFEESFDDEDAFERFVAKVDVATVEFENVPRALLEKVEQRLPLMPSAFAVTTCQHREREKRFLREKGFPTVAFDVVEDVEGLARAVAAMPSDECIVKTAEFGYDGKGQRQVAKGASGDELEEIWRSFDCARAVVEEKVALAAELSVLVVRAQNGATVTFDPAENQHRNHVLDVSIVPARLPDEILSKASTLAVEVARAMEYVGVLAVEFFLTEDDRLLVNELAPRPHNSGHHTIDACETSQFEQQLRVIAGLPLGSTKIVKPAVLCNLLGDLWLDSETPPDWTPVLGTPGAALHIYGKSGARPGRKMGHITFRGDTRDEAIARANACRDAYGLPPIE